ncbi:hypothetical protein HAX54_026358 [Datura stramonium]|uniref:F-box domain-containing protein n=1 Tax=Datura stramonium TaxID=4076 RepID=A0ABS8RKW9_DATST|nr:hypothetical protein [Datura stramonium]
MEESNMHKNLAVIAAVDVIASNADLLSEILLRLPARSLIRFSIVCKRWFNIITRRQFSLSHSRTLALSNGLSPSGIYFYNCLTKLQKIESLSLTDDNVISLPSLQFLDELTNIIIINGDHIVEVDEFRVTQSCNGLLMCLFTTTSDAVTTRKGFVYNPANKASRVLPPVYENCADEFVYYNLISDPSKPPYYKVLCVARIDNNWYSDIDASVYEPGSDSWRRCCTVSAPEMGFDSGVFWNGAIHWIGEYVSLYFDVNSEKFGTIIMPAKLQGQCTQKIRYFGEWGGHLHLIQVQSLSTKRFSVLELDKDTLEWSVKYRVHLDRLISAFPEMVRKTALHDTQYAFSILSVIRGENEENSVLLLTISGKVVAYNLVLKTVKVVRELPGKVANTLCFNHTCAYQYVESLNPIGDKEVKEYSLNQG